MKAGSRYLLFFLILLLISQRIVAQGNLTSTEVSRILSPQNERFQFIAIAEGPEAMRLNPASVASSRGINFHYNFFIDRGKILEHDLSLQNFLFNVAYRRSLDRSMDYHLNEYTVTLGFGVPEVTFGASYNFLRGNLPHGSNGNILHLGALIRPIDRLSIAAAKTNINQPVIGNVKLVGTNIVGAGFHPLTEMDRLALAAEASLPNGGRINDDVAYKFGADFLIIEGLRVYGVYEKLPPRGSNKFSIGLNLYIPNVDFYYDAQFDHEKEYQNGVAGVTFSSERKKTVFIP